MKIDEARGRRRSDALSKGRILVAAVQILDRDGAAGLTLRSLMSELSTGSGAIYHHVANMDELRAAAADSVLRQALREASGSSDPVDALRSEALSIFDTVMAHEWLAGQLARSPFQPAVLFVWTTIGRQLHRLGITGEALSNAGAALSGYILGASQQNGLPRRSSTHADRSIFLAALAEEWQSIDPDPVVAEIAGQLRDHDDRTQFLAGVEIVLAGVMATSTREATPQPGTSPPR